jgi:hypothetical protein
VRYLSPQTDLTDYEVRYENGIPIYTKRKNISRSFSTGRVYAGESSYTIPQEYVRRETYHTSAYPDQTTINNYHNPTTSITNVTIQDKNKLKKSQGKDCISL